MLKIDKAMWCVKRYKGARRTRNKNIAMTQSWLGTDVIRSLQTFLGLAAVKNSRYRRVNGNWIMHGKCLCLSWAAASVYESGQCLSFYNWLRTRDQKRADKVVKMSLWRSDLRKVKFIFPTSRPRPHDNT